MGSYPISQVSAKRRLLPAALAAVSPFRYGLAAVIVVTVAYAVLSLFPLIRSNLHVLEVTHQSDGQGLQSAGQLKSELDIDRLDSIRLLLVQGDGEQTAKALQAMRAQDAEIERSATALARLDPSGNAQRDQFHRSWIAYQAARDKALAAAQPVSRNGQTPSRSSLSPAVAALESDEAAFAQATQAAEDWRKSFAAISAQHLAEVSRSMRRALFDWYVMTGAKILILILLMLTDWKRDRAEKQLEQATLELRATEERLHMAYDSSAVGMGIITLDGTILSVNDVAARILGYEREELVGNRVADFVAPEFRSAHLEHLQQLALKESSSYRSERRYICKDGSGVWIRNNVNCIRLKTGERQCFFTSEEITHQRQANDRLAYLANFDPVTNLPSRHSFEEQLAATLQRESTKGDCVALLYIEIDSFDFLKGTFGRNAADDVLSELAASLAKFQQEGELLGRLDDHVFAFIMRATPYDEATVQRASELQEIFHHFSQSGKLRIPLSASIGIAYSEPAKARTEGARKPSTSPVENQSSYRNGHDAASEALLKFARAAMLEARARGGDAIFVADPSLQERAAQRHQIESALLRGLHRDEFSVVFQPQFQVSTGNLVRFEALCRWNSAELGNVSPDRFIPIAEQTGLISEIGRRVMTDALHQAGMWTQSGRRIGVAVNISPMQFMRPDFTDVITDVLASSGFPPELLELEITEGIFIRDLNLAVVRIRELQRLGLSVALDDFGTGYSSLSYLQRMPIDAVKLDRSFVSDLTSDAATVSMVRSVLSMAEALNLRVVSEGVETDAQLQILRSLGCDEAQGYLLGRPESAELALRRVFDGPLQPLCTPA